MDEASKTDDGAEYDALLRELGLSSDFELLPKARRCEGLRNTGVAIRDLLRFLNLRVQLGAIWAFGGSIRPSASGMQSYVGPPPVLRLGGFPFPDRYIDHSEKPF